MKMGFKKILYLVVISVIAISVNRAGAQGVGNHFTMSLKNCTQIAANVIQFDLYIMSDGASNSDLRANSFQFGVNFNTGILQNGATITPSYVSGTSDFTPPLNAPFFTPSSFPDHIRITTGVFTGANTGNTMTVGHDYKAGTFKITGSSNFVPNTSPNFSLQDVSSGGHTPCAVIAWIGTTTSTTGFSSAGSGDGFRNVSASCNLLITSSKELKKNEQLKIYPNPIRNQFTISDLAGFKVSGSVKLNIYDLLGKQVYTDALSDTRNEETINFNAPAGVYFVEVSSGEKQLIQKLIVQ